MKKHIIILLLISLLICSLALYFFRSIFNVSRAQRLEKFQDGSQSPIIYCFWTGDNPMSPNRKESLNSLQETSECKILLITKQNLNKYVLPDHPLHPAFEYLSETHKADYLRTYFMHFYGGGYSDIKKTSGSWTSSFYELNRRNNWICGYKEVEGGVGYKPLESYWQDLIGNCAYICKPNTPLTNEWYNTMLNLLNEKYEQLKIHPSANPRDCAELGNGYPIKWTEMLGDIFHQVCYKYKEQIMNTLPISIFANYQ